MRPNTYARAVELETAGKPFAVATVVAVQRPTSARPGASAIALAALGAASGWRVSLFDPLAASEDFPAVERVSAETDLATLDPGVSPYVVVATQGVWDEEAVAAALGREASYVGLVASPT